MVAAPAAPQVGAARRAAAAPAPTPRRPAAPGARAARGAAAPRRAAPPGGDLPETHASPVATPSGPPRGGKGSVAAHSLAALVPAAAPAATPGDAPPAPPPAALLQQLLASPPVHGGMGSPPAAPPAPAPAQLPPLEILSGFESDFELGELLGRGTFGEVRVASRRADGAQRAVKIMSKRVNGRDAREAILGEVDFCRMLQACAISARLHGVYEVRRPRWGPFSTRL
jgi:hypothetical protein